MAVNIPQVITPDSASGALIVDGSLKFDKDINHYLSRTPSSDGNRNNWTISCWIKRGKIGTANQRIFETANNFAIRFGSDNFQWIDGASGANGENTPAAVLRDTGWYHCVFSWDSSAGVYGNRIYVNGVELDYNQTGGGNPNTSSGWNVGSSLHTIGRNGSNTSRYYDGMMTQCYFVDGLTLGPGYFGFTDPLTGTWRPRKFEAEGTTVNDGRVFSSTGTFSNWDDDGSYPRTELFDGTIYTGGTPNGAAPDDGNPATFDFGDQKITGFQNLKINIFISSNQVGASNLASVNGIDITNEIHEAGNNTWTTVDLGSKFTTLKSFTIKNNNCYVGGFIIDGVVMQDSTTQNLDFGANGFYLPMDGNSPIGQDKSGKGNDWTPIGFGGSNTIEKATGALPILNTLGGTVARPGVFGSEVGFRETVSSSSGGGNPYIFDTRGTQPTLSFIRGATYVFDYSSATSHPLRFATAADAAGSTEYTDGTSVSGNVISFTVPHNAPDTLYYYCTNHTGMGNSISVTTDTKKADPYAWKCVLAQPLIGSATDESNKLNVGSSTKTVTVNSAVASNDQSNFYGESYYFNGSSTIALSDLNGGTNISDFTFESWIYLPSVSSQSGFFSNQTSDNLANTMRIGSSGSGSDFWMKIGSSSFATSDGRFKASKWFHVAVTRSGSTVTIFLDGVSIGTMSTSEAISPSGFYLGVAYPTTTFRMTGYMQDVRFYTTAKYTSDFIPASTNPDILPDTPSGVGTKTQLTKITDGGSISFGTAQSDYLHLDSSGSDLTLTTNFSIEFFYNEASSRTHGAFITDGGGTNSSANSNSGISYQFYHNPGEFYLNWSNGSGNWGNINSITMPSSSGWHHVVVTNDGSRTRLIVDGELLSSSTVYPTWGYATSSKKMYIGTMSAGPGTGTQGSYNSHGFMSDIRICNGSIPTEYQTSATTNGTYIFSPPARSLTTTSQGANSSHVKLLCAQSQTSSTAAAVSPVTIAKNGNVFGSNFNPFNTDINTVRGQEGSYATMNPLDKHPTSATEDGNLVVSNTSNLWCGIRGTFGRTSGKFYYEVKTGGAGSGGESVFIGLGSDNPLLVTTNNPQGDNTTLAAGTVLYCDDGQKILDSSTRSSYGTAISNQDLIGVAYDLDNKTIEFFNDGTSQGVIDFSSTICGGANQIVFPYYISYYNSTKSQFNFGQKPFKYAPPDGFQPLTSSTVRPDTVIARPDQYFGTTLYTGNAGTKSIDVGHKPDFVWVKARTGSARSHFLFDSVRGVQKFLQTDGAAGESNADPASLTSFNNDGFTTGARAGMNENGVNYVAWTWKAGGNKNTFNVDDVGYATAAAAGLTGGDSSSVTGCSIGTKQGFSIIKYSGANTTQLIPHGLGQAPRLCIVKNLTDGSTNWVTSAGGSGGIFSDSVMFLNSTDANNAGLDGYWGGTSANSTGVHVGGNQQYTNQDSKNYIMYNWIDVPGLQKFGTYEGTGAAPNYVHLGFRPALIWIKNADTTAIQNWGIIDSTRSYANVGNHTLALNLSNPESGFGGGESVFGASNKIDLLSDGFALRETTGFGNASGITFVYCAWAEAPQFNLYGATSNAR